MEQEIQKQGKQKMSKDLTTGPITKSLLIFALPMMAGNLLQQFYNVADTLIVGRFLGKEALAAVGSAYALMTFLTSVILGLCMGSGVVISLCYGKKDRTRMGYSVFQSFVLITGLSLVMTGVVFAGMDGILKLLQVPAEIYQLLRSYLWVIFWGIFAT